MADSGFLNGMIAVLFFCSFFVIKCDNVFSPQSAELVYVRESVPYNAVRGKCISRDLFMCEQ